MGIAQQMHPMKNRGHFLGCGNVGVPQLREIGCLLTTVMVVVKLPGKYALAEGSNLVGISRANSYNTITISIMRTIKAWGGLIRPSEFSFPASILRIVRQMLEALHGC